MTTYLNVAITSEWNVFAAAAVLVANQSKHWKSEKQRTLRLASAFWAQPPSAMLRQQHLHVASQLYDF